LLAFSFPNTVSDRRMAAAAAAFMRPSSGSAADTNRSTALMATKTTSASRSRVLTSSREWASSPFQVCSAGRTEEVQVSVITGAGSRGNVAS
jgi:hypothetical protein